MRADVYISADVETDGPVPGRNSLLSFGLAVAGTFDGESFEVADPSSQTFYRELQPAFDEVDPDAIAVTGLDRERLLSEGEAPAAALDAAADWVRRVAPGHRAVMVAFPLAFDWLWMQWHFLQMSSAGSPFSFSSCLDMKTLLWASLGQPLDAAGLQDLPKELSSGKAHTHNALDDAIEQAEIFAKLWPFEAVTS